MIHYRACQVKCGYFCKNESLKTILYISIFLSANWLVGQDQKNVVLLDNWNDTTLEKGLEEAVFNDVWGFAFEDKNYCVIGSNAGTHFFEVTKDELKLVDFEPGKFQNPFVEHRDFAVYQNYLYGVSDEGTASLQIFDFSYLPDSVSKVYDSDEFFQICHTIYIDTAKAKLYACGPNNVGMQILDISEPTNPILEYVYAGVGYVHDCYVRNDTAFLNCAFDGLRIYDFSGAEPIELGILDFYPAQGYNHSGWLSPNGDKYVFIDETKGTKVKLCTWESLATISITETFGTKDFDEYIPHNVFLLDHLAIISYYNEGLRIFDISKSPIKEIGAYDTFLKDTKYRLNGAWGVYVFPEDNQILIADRQTGLYLFEFPIQQLDNDQQGTLFSTAPFIDNYGYIIPRDYLDQQGLTFSIFASDGKIMYEQSNFFSYLSVPLGLSTGLYFYSISDEFGDFVESGKFVFVQR